MVLLSTSMIFQPPPQWHGHTTVNDGVNVYISPQTNNSNTSNSHTLSLASSAFPPPRLTKNMYQFSKQDKNTKTENNPPCHPRFVAGPHAVKLANIFRLL